MLEREECSVRKSREREYDRENVGEAKNLIRGRGRRMRKQSTKRERVGKLRKRSTGEGRGGVSRIGLRENMTDTGA